MLHGAQPLCPACYIFSSGLSFFLSNNSLLRFAKGVWDDNIIFISAIGPVTEEIAKAGESSVVKFSAKNNCKTNILVDLTDAGQPEAKAIRIYLRVAEMDTVGNIAMFGSHPVARVLGSLMVNIGRKKNFKFFKTQEEAMIWLKEK